MERSFAKEIALLRQGDGEVFEGEGILAITKALLQAGVSYIGGYQGAPVSHLMDVLGDARDLLDDLGVHFEANANEAGAAAMLGASINYPLRGAAVWKSTVGTNVASDALSNLASAGVIGGALIILGEDYGEGSSIIQERTHAFAMKSQMWLLDPRPDHARFVELIERAFELSEASNTPVMMEFRIRACHMHGRFVCKDNKPAAHSKRHDPLVDPNRDYGRICLPPSIYVQEKHKVEVRLPRALQFIASHGLNERFDGARDDIGIILQGGLYNTVIRALQQLGLADAFGASDIPILCLNVTYPLLPDEIEAFCRGKRAVLMVEEGQPDHLEQAVGALLRKAAIDTTLVGKAVLPMAGEYTAETVLRGLVRFLEGSVPHGIDLVAAGRELAALDAAKERAAELVGDELPRRPPGFCTGCPERPVFSALKLAERDYGKVHVAADIGCTTFATLEPFHMGNTVLGYGFSLASAPAVAHAFDKRVISVMGDGGFWHNGLATGVSGAVFNQTDSVLVIVDNGYASATGQQAIPSSSSNRQGAPKLSIEAALTSLGVRWIEVVRSYDVGKMRRTLRKAMTTAKGGLKVIIARGECQLARQRRVKPATARKLQAGERVVRTKFGVDASTCTGDHSCIRLSGCPTLTIKDNPDPLRRDPVAHVTEDCVGCGLCGNVAHAAGLCPSFHRAEVIHNPGAFDRGLDRLRRKTIDWLSGARRAEMAG